MQFVRPQRSVCSMAFSLRRPRTHATIALANALAIFITLYSGWTLTEATLAYLGEFVILALVVYARLFAAKNLDGIGTGGWELVGRQAIAIGITLPLFAKDCCCPGARCAASHCAGPAFWCRMSSDSSGTSARAPMTSSSQTVA